MTKQINKVELKNIVSIINPAIIGLAELSKSEKSVLHITQNKTYMITSYTDGAN